jgi:hypothetical protein
MVRYDPSTSYSSRLGHRALEDALSFVLVDISIEFVVSKYSLQL